MLLFCINVSFVSYRNSQVADVFQAENIIHKTMLNGLRFLVLEEEEPIDGGHLGEATITCSGEGFGRCYFLSIEPCEYDMYSQTTLEARCHWTGSEEYYCSRFLVSVCNYIFQPLSW